MNAATTVATEDSQAAGEAAKATVAVLMCVHAGANAAEFDVALVSLKEQTHANLRIFLYCDGPLKPEHERVLSRRLDAANGRDQIIRGAAPAGLPTGLNALIDCAMVDASIGFYARMDADDIAMPERIGRQLEFLQQHPEVTIVGTWCIEFNQPGVPLFHKQMPSQRDDVARSMLMRNALAHPTVMFRRGVFERGHRYDARQVIMQDYELWSRLIVAGEVISNVPDYLLWFRIGDGFFNRRHGVRRAWDEIRLRLRYARNSGLLRPAHILGLCALFLVRVMPGSAKRLAYKHLR
jgi:Glycosyl transferase family 2